MYPLSRRLRSKIREMKRKKESPDILTDERLKKLNIYMDSSIRARSQWSQSRMVRFSNNEIEEYIRIHFDDFNFGSGKEQSRLRWLEAEELRKARTQNKFRHSEYVDSRKRKWEEMLKE